MAKYLDITGLTHFKEKLQEWANGAFRKITDKINAVDVLYNEKPLAEAITSGEFKGDKGDPGEKGQDGDPGAAAGFGTPQASVDANVGTPSVTVSASGPDTAKIFDFSFKNLKGAKGDKGDNGEKGETGTRGSRWSQGTAITGTNTEGVVFSESGITDALINDNYLNTQTGYVYRCVSAGVASVAKWAYTGSIKGPEGDAANIQSITTTEIDNLFESA